MNSFDFIIVAGLAFVLLAQVDAQKFNVRPEQKHQFEQLIDACKREQKVSQHVVEKFRKGQFENTSHEAKCFLNCVGSKGNMFVNGQLNTEVIRQAMGPIVGNTKLLETMHLCNDIQDCDNCEKAFKLYKCYYKRGSVYL